MNFKVRLKNVKTQLKGKRFYLVQPIIGNE